jgi:lipopolysaccharide export system protein LptC
VSSRQLLVILVLMLLAGGTRWWLTRMENVDGRTGGLPEARSEYTLDNFELLVMDKQGLPSFQVESEHLEKLPADDSVVLQSPSMYLFADGEKTWRIDAQSGWIRQDGEELVLRGNVLMSKGEEKERFIIRARNLRLYPQQELAESDEPVSLSRPGTAMRGVGLKARLDVEKFELLSEVKGRYVPQNIQ